MYTDVRIINQQHLLTHQAFQEQTFQAYNPISPSLNIAFQPHQQTLHAPAPYPTGPTFGYPSPPYNNSGQQVQTVSPSYSVSPFSQTNFPMNHAPNSYAMPATAPYIQQRPAFPSPPSGMGGALYNSHPISMNCSPSQNARIGGPVTVVGGARQPFFHPPARQSQSPQRQLLGNRLQNHEAQTRSANNDTRASASPAKSQSNDSSRSHSSRRRKPYPKREITPWLIGQRVVVKIDGRKKFGTIKDYKSRTKRSHVWFDDSGTDDLLLDKKTLDFVFLQDRLPEAPKLEWKPAAWARSKGTAVQVKYEETNEWYVGRIDGFDPESRRSHVVYSADTSEWAWATGKKIRRYSGDVADYIPKDSVAPPAPPFDPVAYGLPDPSLQPQNSPSKKRPRSVVDLTSDNSPSPESSHLRRSHDADTKTGKHRGVKRSFIDLADDDNDEPPVSPRRKRPKLHKSCMTRHRHSRFPCHVKINGRKWKRHHAADEKKYFWVTEDNESQQTSWNPWIENDMQAPWQKKLSYWEKFYEDDQAYYHNFKTDETVSDRPAEYYSAGEIYDDSCDEEYIKEKAQSQANRKHRKSKSARKKEYERNKRRMTPTALPSQPKEVDPFDVDDSEVFGVAVKDSLEEMTRITADLGDDPEEDVYEDDEQRARHNELLKTNIWAAMEEDLKEHGYICFEELFSHHAKNLVVPPSVRAGVMEIFVKKESLYLNLRSSVNEWMRFQDNLQSKFVNRLQEALTFLIKVANANDEDRFEKCFSLMRQNSEDMTRLFEQLRMKEPRRLLTFVLLVGDKIKYREQLHLILKAHVCRDWVTYLIVNRQTQQALKLIRKLAVISPYFQVACIQRHLTEKFAQAATSRRDRVSESLPFLEALQALTLRPDALECATRADDDMDALGFSVKSLLRNMKRLLIAIIPQDKPLDFGPKKNQPPIPLSTSERQMIRLCCAVLENLLSVSPPQWLRKTDLGKRCDRIGEFLKGEDCTFAESLERGNPSLALCMLRFIGSPDMETTSGITRVFRLLFYSNGFINASDYYYEYQKECKNGPTRNDRQGLDWIRDQLLFTYSESDKRRLNPKFHYQHRRRFRAALLICLMFEPTMDHPQTRGLIDVADVITGMTEYGIQGRWYCFFAQVSAMKRCQNAKELKQLYDANQNIAANMPDDAEIRPWSKSFDDIIRSHGAQASAKLCTRLRNNMRVAIRYCVNYDGRLSSIVSLLFRGRMFHYLLGILHMETWDSGRMTGQRACVAFHNAMTKEEKRYVSNCQLPYPNNREYMREEDTDLKKGLSVRRVSRYQSDKSILVCGDGDLTFGRALCRKFGLFTTKATLDAARAENRQPSQFEFGSRNVVVTCYESALELLKLYPKSPSVVHEIRSRGGHILFGVDATNLEATMPLVAKYHKDDRAFPVFEDATAVKLKKWDVIVWNFPHAFVNHHIPRVNGELVRDFFRSATQILAPRGEIHVSFHINQHLTEGHDLHQYSKWDIPQHARASGLRTESDFDFCPENFSGYAVKNVGGNPFNILKAKTYVFKLNY